MRAAACADDNPVACEEGRRAVVEADGYFLFAGKGRRTVIRIHRREAVVVPADGFAFIDLFPEPFRQELPVEGHVFGVDANAAGFTDFANGVRCRNQHLRRNTAAVQACAAKAPAFDEGNCFIFTQRSVGDDISGAGANDDDIIMFHGDSSFVGGY